MLSGLVFQKVRGGILRLPPGAPVRAKGPTVVGLRGRDADGGGPVGAGPTVVGRWARGRTVVGRWARGRTVVGLMGLAGWGAGSRVWPGRGAAGRWSGGGGTGGGGRAMMVR
jgi:hypothetical protein